MVERWRTRDRVVHTHGPYMRGMIFGFLILAIGNGWGLYAQWNLSQANKERIAQTRVTAVRLELLTGRLCDALSLSRVASNFQIRRPLRVLLKTQAQILTVAAKSPVNRGTKRARLYRAKARVLHLLANDVPNVSEFTCAFRDG